MLHTKAITALFLAVSFALPVLVAPANGEAAVIRTSGDTVSVPDDSVVPDDFYALGSEVKVLGAVEGDLYVASGAVTVTGPISGDLVVLGGNVSVRGSVGDDVRVVGGKATLEGSVGGDIFSSVGTLTIERSSEIAGDVFFYGGDLEIDGIVAGVVYARGAELSVDGEVGAIDAIAEEVRLGNRAHVAGSVNYQSASQIFRAQESRVEGEILRQVREEKPEDALKGRIVFASMMLFASLLAILLFRERFESMFGHLSPSLGISGFIGLGFFLAAPFAIVLLMVSILGIFAGVFLLLLYIGLLLAAFVLTGVFIGTLCMRYFKRSYQVSWLAAFIGILAIELLLFIPVVGPILVFACFLATLGTLLRSFYHALRG